MAKKNAKKASAKKSPKKAAKKSAKKAASNPKDRAMSKVPIAERRVAFLKLLKKLGAVSGTTAKSCSMLAEKLGYTSYDVYCLGYTNYKLATDGLVKSTKIDGEKGLHFYLTAKGQKAA